jgi:hypothetical protein
MEVYNWPIVCSFGRWSLVVAICPKCGVNPRGKFPNSTSWCGDCVNTANRARKAQLSLEERRQMKQKHKEYNTNYEKNRYKVFTPVVYAYFDSSGKALYVGRGTFDRVRQHKYRSPWYPDVSLLITMTCDSEWHAMEMEGKWGGRYQPIHNKDGYRHQSSKQFS